MDSMPLQAISRPSRLPEAEAAPPRPSRWCPSGATSSRATPRPPTRSRPSWPRPWPPPASRRPDHRRGPGPLDLRCPAVEPLGQGLRPRPHGLPPAHAGPGRRPAGSHRRPREALQAGVTRGRQDLGDGGPAALGLARHLPPARRQGAGLLGDGPGHRRGQGTRQSRRTRRRL